MPDSSDPLLQILLCNFCSQIKGLGLEEPMEIMCITLGLFQVSFGY